MLLQVPWPVVLVGHLPEEDPLESLPELWAEDGVDDGVQGRVEVAQPQEEGHKPAEQNVGFIRF